MAELAQGAWIGILGGGQLGRMLATAAARLGYRCHIYAPEPDPPAGHVAARLTTAAYDDAASLRAFAASVDVVTYEFENVPVVAVRDLATLAPPARALAVSQDRLVEKRFLQGLGLDTAPFAPVDDAEALRRAVAEIGRPAILKTRRMGYDGKGQTLIDCDALPRVVGPSILEGVVAFDRELSVIAARGRGGEVVCYDPVENVHAGGILRQTTVPAQISLALRTDAALIAGRILAALDYVGVLGVELFQSGGRLLVNEIAPRVHNSGHWTQNACAVDQFEQHIRAIAGWPLGDGSRHADVTMENLLGEDLDRLPTLARDPAVALHLYGKAEARPGRKMGHANRILPRAD